MYNKQCSKTGTVHHTAVYYTDVQHAVYLYQCICYALNRYGTSFNTSYL
jgi:hypothetical protein